VHDGIIFASIGIVAGKNEGFMCAGYDRIQGVST